MDDEPLRNLTFDHNFTNYRPFFDHGWATTIVQIAHGTPVFNAVFDLSLNLKAASNTHAMPFLMVQSLQNFWEGMKSEEIGRTFAPTLVRHISQRLTQEVQFTHTKRRDVQKALDKLASEALTADEVSKSTYLSVEDIWSGYTTPGKPGSAEFLLILYGSQRFCYGSMVHAYENFIREVLCTKNGQDENWRPNVDAMSKEIGKYFGTSVAGQCIDDAKIRAAIEVRHALAHRGGRENDKTRKVQHGLDVVDGRLQILAADNRVLFELLKERALLLVQAAV